MARLEKIILEIFCNCIYEDVCSKSKIENNTVRKIGQPGFVTVQFSGNPPKTMVSTAYEKFANESIKIGTSGSYTFNRKNNEIAQINKTKKNTLLVEKNVCVLYEILICFN